MNKEELIQRRKKLLTDVFEYFQKNNEFPDKKSFRVTRVDDWDLLDELERLHYFEGSYNEKKYILKLKGLLMVENAEAKKIIEVGDQLIPVFQDFYRSDQSEDRKWTVDEIHEASKIPKADIQRTLYFINDLYLYFRGINGEGNKPYQFNTIKIDERILKATKIEDFRKKYFEDNEEAKPFFPNYEDNNVIPNSEDEDRIVAFLDVLGFKSINENNKDKILPVLLHQRGNQVSN